MRIGVDLRVLQIGHQYRGIGEVTKQCLNRVFKLALADKSKDVSFVLFEYDGSDPKEFLNIPEGLNYSEVSLGPQPAAGDGRGFLRKLTDKRKVWLGNPLPEARGACDVFLQLDYALGVPRRPKSVLVSHDIIPLIFWNDYFESPWLHVKHKAARTTIRTVVHNREFIWKLKRAHRRAARVLCVSESTRQDLIKRLGLPQRKLAVMPLGVSEQPAGTGAPSAKRQLPTKPYLLFIGGIDKRRRRVDDIVAAFNNLRAAGHDIQLVLVGENFQSVDKIPDLTVRTEVMNSSYKNDILNLGYIDDETKQELFRRALAFVFPTIYEGFGIPVLEAMLHGCPVIAYRNSSIPEVGGDNVLYAKDWAGIKARVEELLTMPAKERSALSAAAKKRAQKFTWDKTAKILYQALLSLR